MTATIETSHLSSFAVTTPTSRTPQKKTYKGVGKKHEPIEEHPELKESIGVHYLIALLGIFAVGFVATCIADAKKK